MSDSHWTDKPNPEFEQWWATKTAEGYQYGREALENVRFGFEGAQEMRWRPIETAPKDGTGFLVSDINKGYVNRALFMHGELIIIVGRHDATHWMPLPDPPSLEPAGKQSNLKKGKLVDDGSHSPLVHRLGPVSGGWWWVGLMGDGNG